MPRRRGVVLEKHSYLKNQGFSEFLIYLPIVFLSTISLAYQHNSFSSYYETQTPPFTVIYFDIENVVESKRFILYPKGECILPQLGQQIGRYIR